MFAIHKGVFLSKGRSCAIAQLKHLTSTNYDLKKLVYVFVANYGHQQPEKIMEIISTLVRDARDQSPLLRALALRTMSTIRHEQIFAHILTPLKEALRDKCVSSVVSSVIMRVLLHVFSWWVS